MIKVGFIGWRGMVGSVLMERMSQEHDFKNIEPVFFTTSQVGQAGPTVKGNSAPLKDAYDINELTKLDVIVTSQGSGFTKKVHGILKEKKWKGYWIDAASSLRMQDDSVIVLDPVNRDVIDEALKKGVRNFIGGNCTVSLMLMAVSGLFKKGLVEWLTSMTYQSASGAGAQNMRELVSQMSTIGSQTKEIMADPSTPISEIDQLVRRTMNDHSFPITNFGAPLAGSALPWIDTPMETGQSREEWKGLVETNKILQTKQPIPIDGICVRIGTMRCHCQALTIKLTKDIPTHEIEQIISTSNEWVQVVQNTKEDTLKYLTPGYVTQKLTVPVGRIRKLNIGPEYITMFTVGDQLLWGAAEPLRRILNIITDYIK